MQSAEIDASYDASYMSLAAAPMSPALSRPNTKRARSPDEDSNDAPPDAVEMWGWATSMIDERLADYKTRIEAVILKDR